LKQQKRMNRSGGGAARETWGRQLGRTVGAAALGELGGLAGPRPSQAAGTTAALGGVRQSEARREPAGKRWRVLGSERKVKGSWA